MNALVVVAHDDDALIWMVGTINHLSDWNWHIISMCNDQFTDRKDFFRETCSKLGVKKYNAFDFRDYQNIPSIHNNSINDMMDEIQEATTGMKYDYIFTHSRDPDGEYSFHANHYEVCQAVKSMVSKKKLVENQNRLVYFCYYPIYGLIGLAPVARLDAKWYFQLTYEDLALKVKLIKSNRSDLVNNLEKALGAPCPNPEAFEGDGLSLPPPFIGRSM